MPFERKRVLLVEDDHAVRSLASEALHTFGLSVVEAGSGLAAIRLLEEGDIAIVVTDISMPVPAALKLRVPHVPSSRASHSVHFGGSKPAGSSARPAAQHCIAKPFTMNELTEAVGVLLTAAERKQGENV